MDIESLIKKRSQVLKAIEERDLSPEKRQAGWDMYDNLSAQIQAALKAEAQANANKLRQGTML